MTHKGEEVEPRPHVDDLTPGRPLAEAFHQQGRVLLDGGLLGLERGVGEALGKDPAVAVVLLLRLQPDEARRAEHVLLVGPQRELRRHGLLAAAVAVYLLQGGGGGVGQLVGGEAHDRAVLLVEFEHAVVDGASDLGDDLGDVGAAPEERARKAGERVKVDIVDELADGESNCLGVGTTRG